jgi:hypothetical protein
MDIAAYAKKIAEYGLPLLGAALPVPGGAAIGAALASAIASPSAAQADILSTLQASADAVAKARQFESDHAEHMLKIATDAEVAQVQAVNATLQTEAMAGSWLQRNHHAIESLTATSSVIAIYFALPLLHEPVPTVPEFAWVMLGGILGVTAWQRGAANVVAAKG